MDEDWPAIFGETPGANAYGRQLAEFRKQADVAARKAEEAADSAVHAEMLCSRAKNLAESMVARQDEHIRVASQVRIATWVVAVCTLLVITSCIVMLVWNM